MARRLGVAINALRPLVASREKVYNSAEILVENWTLVLLASDFESFESSGGKSSMYATFGSVMSVHVDCIGCCCGFIL
jgi:hypothetical protein